MTNKELIESYPWLARRNRYNDELLEDDQWTELDDMPDGWRIAFGEQMCKEMNNEMLTWSEEEYDDFRIIEIKEKYGSLRVYVNHEPEKLHEIIKKYSKMSEEICVDCGKPARWISTGWVCPYCDNCAHEIYKHTRKSDWNKCFIEIKKED